MSIQDRRTTRGWTQEQLAQQTGLSVRTVQRLEKGQTATLESLKCLAAVFDTSVSTLMQEQGMASETTNAAASAPLDTREAEAIHYVQNLKGLIVHGILFAVILPALGLFNLIVTPHSLWILWAAGGWLFGLAIHLLVFFIMFGLFGPVWEQRQFLKRLGRPDAP